MARLALILLCFTAICLLNGHPRAGAEQPPMPPQAVRVKPSQADPPRFVLGTRVVPIKLPRPDSYLLTDSLTVSPDLSSVAYRHRFGVELDREGIALNSDNILSIDRATDPTLSPDGQSIATVCNNDGWLMMLNRKRWDGYDPVTPVRFSPDGRRMIYLAREEHQRFVVEYDWRHPVCDAVDWDRLIFTPDSSVLAYPAKIGNQWHMMVNGDPGPGWDRIVSPVVTAEAGPSAFYVALRAGRYHVADRHTAGPGFRMIHSAPAVSDDGRVFAYWAMGDDFRWRVIRNHKPVSGLVAEKPGQLILSPDGQTLAATFKRDDLWHVAFRGRLIGSYASIGQGSLLLSPDSRHVAYAIHQPAGWTVMLDDTPLAALPRLAVNGIRFSPSGDRLVCVAGTSHGWHVWEKPIADPSDSNTAPNSQIKHRVYEAIDVKSLTFSPDGKHLAYLAERSGRSVVVRGGEELGEYERAAHLTFDPTSEYLAYTGSLDGAWQVFVNGMPTGETFDELLPTAGIIFHKPDRCRTLALRHPGPELIRVEVVIKPDDSHDPTPADGPDPSLAGVESP
ncbi:MAG: hypothetical protein Kow00105_19510 [Phycisphaeraceae bacterium]